MNIQNEISIGSLVIQLKYSTTRFRTQWCGEAEDLDPNTTVLPALENLANKASTEAQTFVVDLSRLEYMNSSFIGMLMNFFMILDERNINAELIFNTNKTWQILVKRCALSLFPQSDHVHIADIGQDATI